MIGSEMNFEYLEVRKGGLPRFFQSVSKVLSKLFLFLDNYSYLDTEFQKSGASNAS